MARSLLAHPMGPSWGDTHALLEREAPSVGGALSVGVWRGNEPELFRYAYTGTSCQEGPKVNLDTVYDLASLTKVLVTAPLVAQLVERGWIGWQTRLKEFFPVDPSLTVENLMTHHSGLPDWKPFFESLRQEFPNLEHETMADRQALMRRLVFEVKPGAVRTLYSDVGMLLLGFLVEDLTGLRLDQAARRHLWKPLGIEELSYRPVGECKPHWNLASTEDCPWRKRVLKGEVHDDNCWAMGGVAGHAGVFGTLRGVMGFVQALMKGEVIGGDALSEFLLRRPQGERGLGWDVRSASGSLVGELLGPRVVGHWGFSGTGLWLDPETQVAVLGLSNRVHPVRGPKDQINRLRPMLNDQLVGDLGNQPLWNGRSP